MFNTITQKDKLSLRVAQELERSILEKRFVPDQPIPSESRLCETFGVSRTVVREAIQQLKAQGIIRSYPGSGNYIARNDASNLKRPMSLLASLNQDTPLHLEILQLRELLEMDCLKSVAESASLELIESLETHVAMMRENYDNLETFGRADQAFHLCIIKASGNTLFFTILESLYESLVELSLKVYESKATLDRILSEHEAIIEAIKQQDSDQAVALLKAHIQHSKKGI